MSDLHKKLLLGKSGSLPPRPVIPSTGAKVDNKLAGKKQRDYSVIPWNNYFDKSEDIYTNEKKNKFRVYMKGDSGPAFFFLHGGGFSGLSWALLSSILVTKIKCQCYSMDIRGHGESHTTNDEDLSIETMATDVKEVIESIWKNDVPPQIVLVGHSMGGALAVHTAALNYVNNLIGLVVIDVVEGSALEALSSMQTFLHGRPKQFNSIEQAIEYNVRAGAVRNIESARVSIIGQLEKFDTADTGAGQESLLSDLKNIPTQAVMQSEIAEEDEEDLENVDKQTKIEGNDENFLNPANIQSPSFKYKWRIDLTKTEKYWKEWFKGLSNMFLGLNTPKLLLLAGVDRLDKDLMVGQMQGKFQMQILPLCGHAVHEDSPEHVAEALATFMIRHKFTVTLEEKSAFPTLSFSPSLPSVNRNV